MRLPHVHWTVIAMALAAPVRGVDDDKGYPKENFRATNGWVNIW
jgi:hypothetical protein